MGGTPGSCCLAEENTGSSAAFQVTTGWLHPATGATSSQIWPGGPKSIFQWQAADSLQRWSWTRCTRSHGSLAPFLSPGSVLRQQTWCCYFVSSERSVVPWQTKPCLTVCLSPSSFEFITACASVMVPSGKRSFCPHLLYFFIHSFIQLFMITCSEVARAPAPEAPEAGWTDSRAHVRPLACSPPLACRFNLKCSWRRSPGRFAAAPLSVSLAVSPSRAHNSGTPVFANSRFGLRFQQTQMVIVGRQKGAEIQQKGAGWVPHHARGLDSSTQHSPAPGTALCKVPSYNPLSTPSWDLPLSSDA